MTTSGPVRRKNERSGPGALAAAQAASTSMARVWLRPRFADAAMLRQTKA